MRLRAAEIEPCFNITAVFFLSAGGYGVTEYADHRITEWVGRVLRDH